jgi:hypothetical protein
MNKPLKPATQILRGSPRLQRLLRQAESLSKLQALLYQHLAPAQREQLQLGGYDEGVLTLISGRCSLGYPPALPAGTAVAAAASA